MEISIVMCAYNAQEHLRRSIDSILCQSFNDFELLVVDDCSTDATPSIINSYAEADPRIRCLSTRGSGKKNAGPSVARNTGLVEATGKYIYFADADDRLEPDMLEILHARAERDGSQIVCCGYFMETEKTSRKFLYSDFHASVPEEFARHLPSLQSGQLLNVLWNKLFRHDLIDSAGARFPDHMRSGQDRFFNLLLAGSTDSFTFVNRPLYHYVVHGNGITYGYFYEERFQWATEIFAMQKALYERLHILTPENLASLSFMFTKVALSCCTQLFFKSCGLRPAEKKAYAASVIGDGIVVEALKAAKPTKLSHKSIVALLRTGSPAVCLSIARLTAFSSRYLQPLLIRIKY